MKTAIISGKGGTGKSSITSALVSLSKDTLTLDCDVDASNLYLIFDSKTTDKEEFLSGQFAKVDPSKCNGCGICKDACKFDAIKLENGKANIMEVSCDGCGLCSKLCPQGAIKNYNSGNSYIYSGNFRYGRIIYGKMAPGDENSGKLINRLREIADDLCEKENIPNQILDGPPGIGCPVISSLTGIDRVIIVTEPSLSGISDFKRAYELAKSFTDKIYLIINKYDLDFKNTSDIEKYCNSIGIKVIGKLPFDRKMVDAMIHQQSIIEYDPANQCSIEIKKMVDFL
ncbi:MAG: ATP-binding protein [Bacteroidales bacterium]